MADNENNAFDIGQEVWFICKDDMEILRTTDGGAPQFDHSSPIGLFAYARMRRELKERLGRNVDLVEDEAIRPNIAKFANKDRQLVYERAN